MPKMLIKRWSFKYKECVKCGTVDKKHEAKGYCKKCYDLLFMRVKQSFYMKEYRKTHPQKSYRKSTPTGFKYSDAPNIRSNKCEICLKNCNTVLDHNHTTNTFRGWLCNQCNLSLGLVKDNIEILQRMITYLIKNS